MIGDSETTTRAVTIQRHITVVHTRDKVEIKAHRRAQYMCTFREQHMNI